MIIAYECDMPVGSEVVTFDGLRFGIVSNRPGVLEKSLGSGDVGYFLSRLVSMGAIDDSLILATPNVEALRFRCRVVDLKEYLNARALIGYDLAKFERRSQNSSIAFLNRFGQESGLGECQ